MFLALLRNFQPFSLGLVCTTCVSIHTRRRCMHRIRVAEHLGASSRQPRHPFSALMAGVRPGPVPVHRALPRHLEQASRNLLDLPNRDVDHLVNELQMRKLLLRHDRGVNSHKPMRTSRIRVHLHGVSPCSRLTQRMYPLLNQA